jgi:hypothetical protein
MVEWLVENEFERCGRKWSWSNLRHYPGVSRGTEQNYDKIGYPVFGPRTFEQKTAQLRSSASAIIIINGKRGKAILVTGCGVP